MKHSACLGVMSTIQKIPYIQGRGTLPIGQVGVEVTALESLSEPYNPEARKEWVNKTYSLIHTKVLMAPLAPKCH